MKLLIFIILASLPFASAQSQGNPLRVRVTDYGWINGVFEPLRPLLDSYLRDVETNLNLRQPIKDPDRIMKSTANSTAMASRGIGTDYASHMENVLIGVSLGAAADMDRNTGLRDEPLSGLGGATGILFGKKISKKADVFFNFGGLSHSRTFEGIMNTDLNAEITTFSIGAHARYQLMEGSGDDQLGWGGIKLHVGYDYNKNELNFQNRLNEEIDVDLGGSAVLQGRLKGNPVYEIISEIHSIPIEISSNVTFLRYFTFFGGIGTDFNFGESRGKGDIKARAFSPLTCVSGICTGLNLPEVEVVGNLDRKQNVDSMVGRGFGGLQLNLGPVKIYGLLNQTLGSKVVGVNLGMKAVF